MTGVCIFMVISRLYIFPVISDVCMFMVISGVCGIFLVISGVCIFTIIYALLISDVSVVVTVCGVVFMLIAGMNAISVNACGTF